MRKSGFGIRIGSIFAGCLLYADDIVLISCSYYGLQKLINICEMYGKVWDIKFNPLKSQVVTFGGQQPNAIEITMEDSIIPWGGRVKYLGCYFSNPSGEVDLSQSVSKFYGSFNNILNVLGHNRHEMLAVHLIKTYCLSSAVYSCEVWSPKALGLKSLAVAWNNAFRKIFNTCWRESTRSLQFYCNCLPVPYLIDQCRMLFWKKMTVSSNRLLLVLSRLCQTQINSIAAKYGIVQPLVNVSCTRIKWHVWDTFACNVLWLYVGLFADESK